MEGTELVHKGNLETVVGDILAKEKAIVENLNEVLPHVAIESVKASLQRKLQESLECIGALEAGFLPINGGWFRRIDTKSKWARRDVDATLKSMPEVVKEAWKKAEELGVFKSFSVTSGGGDPVLAGNAGKKHFLIAAWVNFEGGYSLGFRMK